MTEHNLMRLGGLRAFYFPETLLQGLCYINGSAAKFPAAIAPIVQLMCDQVVVSTEQLKPWLKNRDFIDFIAQQVTAGYWYFSDS